MGHHVDAGKMNLRLLPEQAFLTTEPGDVILIRVLCVHSCLGCSLLYWLNEEGIAPGVGDGAKTKSNQKLFPPSLPLPSPPSPPLFPSPASLLPFLCFFLPSSLRTGSPCVAWPALTFPPALNLTAVWTGLSLRSPCFCFPMLEFFPLNYK